MPSQNGNGHAQLVDAAGRPIGRQFGYDAVEDKKRRLPPRMILRSEDKELNASKRRKLVATGRDIVRNYSVATWALRKHLDYVASFSFQSRTKNEKFDRKLEELVKWWSRRKNFDVAGRHGLRRFVRMNESRRTLDGDFFWLKLSSGMVQAIEGDRIRNPERGSLPDHIEPDHVTQGVWCTKTGRAKAYCLHNRAKGSGFKFDRMVSARHLIQHGYYDTGRFDQVRGISLIAPGINSLQDTYENIEYGSTKAKVSQMFGIGIRQSPDREESMGDVSAEDDSEGKPDKSRTEIDFGQAPFVVDLYEDEAIDTIESKQPAQEWQSFIELLIMISLKAVDIPYSFFSEKYTNYSGQRQAWLQYELSAEQKRADNRELLDELLAWRIMLWILDGALQLPKSMTISQLRWSWIDLGVPWVQPLQEIKADTLAIEAGLGSTPRTAKRRGMDAYELVDEQAEYLEYRGKQLDKFKAQDQGNAA